MTESRPSASTAQSDAAARRAAWSAYWQAGALHSCVGSWSGNYGGAIAAFWSRSFAALANGARVLDLATGNGPLPQLLLQQRPDDAALRIDAVDAAALAPAWYRADAQPRLRFHQGVAMEALPFADGSFDLVTSQYGFEYADRAPALAELLRVLAPRGRVALVMHHAGSVLVEVARSELRHQARLLADDGLLAAAAAVVPWFALARAGGNPGADPAAGRARAAYNAAQQALSTAIAGEHAPDLLVDVRDAVHRLVAATGADPAPTLAALADWRAALGNAALRSRELVACALHPGDVADLRDAIVTARGGGVTVAELGQEEGVLGWSLESA